MQVYSLGPRVKGLEFGVGKLGLVYGIYLGPQVVIWEPLWILIYSEIWYVSTSTLWVIRVHPTPGVSQGFIDLLDFIFWGKWLSLLAQLQPP